MALWAKKVQEPCPKASEILWPPCTLYTYTAAGENKYWHFSSVYVSVVNKVYGV